MVDKFIILITVLYVPEIMFTENQMKDIESKQIDRDHLVPDGLGWIPILAAGVLGIGSLIFALVRTII
jgi:hypothetical protein